MNDTELNSSKLMQRTEKTPTKKHRSWKKPEDKPKRPLSAYNIFFQLERDRLVNGEEEKTFTRNDVAKVRIVSNDEKPKRRDRKTHGRVAFADLARHVSGKWRQLDAQTKNIFEQRAKLEKNRYHDALVEWEKTKKNTSSRNNASVSSYHILDLKIMDKTQSNPVQLADSNTVDLVNTTIVQSDEDIISVTDLNRIFDDEPDIEESMGRTDTKTTGDCYSLPFCRDTHHIRGFGGEQLAHNTVSASPQSLRNFDDTFSSQLTQSCTSSAMGLASEVYNLAESMFPRHRPVSLDKYDSPLSSGIVPSNKIRTSLPLNIIDPGRCVINNLHQISMRNQIQRDEYQVQCEVEYLEAMQSLSLSRSEKIMEDIYKEENMYCFDHPEHHISNDTALRNYDASGFFPYYRLDPFHESIPVQFIDSDDDNYDNDANDVVNLYDYY